MLSHAFVRKTCSKKDDDWNDGNFISDDSEEPLASANGPGRKGSLNYAFDNTHPLTKHYVQRIRQRFIVPIRAGGTRPAFPKPIMPGETASAAWIHLESSACAFYGANFIPWSCTETPKLSSAEFRLWIKEQYSVFQNPLKPFAERLVACGRVTELRNYTFRGQLNKQDLQMNRQYRQRNRKMWSDEDLDIYFKSCGGADAKKNAEDSIDALRKRQEARKSDVRRLQTAERDEEWVNKLTRDFGFIFGDTSPSDDSSAKAMLPSLSALQANLNRKHISPKAIEVRDASENLYDNEGFSLMFSFTITHHCYHNFLFNCLSLF